MRTASAPDGLKNDGSAQKRVLLAWSGGKDSAWALHVLRNTPGTEVIGLFTTTHEISDRVPIHEVPSALIEAQARAAGLPLYRVAIPQPCPNALYEERLGAFLKTQPGSSHLAFGDLFLEDIRRYRERQFSKSGFGLLFPLWGLPTASLAREMVAAGLRAYITTVDTTRAPAEWAGRVFDEAFVNAIPPGIDPCGENGEFHSFVFEGPMLGARLDVRPGKKARTGAFMHCELQATG